MEIQSYKDLIVWQKSVDLVVAVYEVTEFYPKTEIYGLTSQSRRSAVSIPANIAEGRRLGSKKEFRQFLVIAFGSGAELESHIAVAKKLSFGKNLDFSKVNSLLDEVMRMLNTMIKNLQSNS